MGIECSILGSGSTGNSIYVANSETAILIDAGFSGKETVRRLNMLDVDISRISAICLSHEHNDHISGAHVLNKRHGIPLYANSGTIEGVQRALKKDGSTWQVFTTGSPFAIGSLRIHPFSVPHDAYDPVGFIISSGNVKLGIATDLGMVTTLIRERLRGCQAIVLEANHDLNLLRNSRRPWSLKQRIMGRQGHLSNDKAGETVAELGNSGLSQVFLTHLSEECNRKELAYKTVYNSIGQTERERICIDIADPDQVSERWAAD